MKKTKLPEGWQEVELGNKEYFEIQPSGINKFEGEKDYLSTESIQGTNIEKIECKITYKDRPSRANMQPVLNSVWFAKMQATLKVYSFTQANKGEINGFILSTGFAGIRVDDSKVDPFYLRHFLKSKEFNKIKDSNCSGATQKAIGNEKLSKIKIPLPSLSVQKKIVKLLDRAEQAKQKRKEANKRTKDYLSSSFITLFGDPSENPQKFPIIKIREIVSCAEYGTSKKANEDEEGIPILRMNNITYEGEWDFSDLKHIQFDEKETKKYLLTKGDLLFNRTNSKELVGKTAVFRSDKKMVYAGYLIRVKTNDKANSEYISAFLNSSYGKKILFNMCKNIVGMANINAQELQNIEIPLPPIELQQKFAKIVEQVEKLKEKQQKSKEKINEIFNSLMQKAFKGELVK